MAKALREAVSLDAAVCRKYYDECIQECPSGIIVLHSCAIIETAGDRSDLGGVYCANLIKSAEEGTRREGLDTSGHYYILDVPAVHDAALPAVKQLSGGRQNPQLRKAPIPGTFFHLLLWPRRTPLGHWGRTMKIALWVIAQIILTLS